MSNITLKEQIDAIKSVEEAQDFVDTFNKYIFEKIYGLKKKV